MWAQKHIPIQLISNEMNQKSRMAKVSTHSIIFLAEIIQFYATFWQAPILTYMLNFSLKSHTNVCVCAKSQVEKFNHNFSVYIFLEAFYVRNTILLLFLPISNALVNYYACIYCGCVHATEIK